ncbi:hypothetical protein [Streptomyces sp. bgisy027]|uniref:hypothetical protein n=1 Tax=unclassified Streptomyces TaxID=2593676 RepID=UPI003D72E2CA
MECGILSLSDLQTDHATLTCTTARRRAREVISHAVTADQADLCPDLFGPSEHHNTVEH